jgi:hypothetical protein
MAIDLPLEQYSLSDHRCRYRVVFACNDWEPKPEEGFHDVNPYCVTRRQITVSFLNVLPRYSEMLSQRPVSIVKKDQ